MEWWAAYYNGLSSGLNKGEALYQALRRSITLGFYNKGEHLPSTRETAKALDLSRGTVIQAYESLAAEGYIEAVPGGYTKVCSLYTQAQEYSSVSPKLSMWGQRVQKLVNQRQQLIEDRCNTDTLDLRPNDRSRSLFPEQEWQRCLRTAIRSVYDPSESNAGHAPRLEDAIASHLTRWRGVHAINDHIIITNGSQQALMMITAMLINTGDHVLVETPCFHGIRDAVYAAGGIAEPFACDDDEQLEMVLNQTSARLAIVTPNRQFPTGRSLGAAARKALMTWAENNDALIIEDDYDSDFGFGNRRYEPLQAMDRQGRVIYVGSFTRTMSSELRIGYMVLPEKLVAPIQSLMKLHGIYNVMRIEHTALALCMNSGNYERHLRRINREQRRKVQIFCEIMQEYAGHLFKWYANDIGFHLYAIWRQDPTLYEEWSKEAQRQGVIWSDGSVYSMTDNEPRSVLFGIIHVEEEAWEQACKRMSLAWNVVMNRIRNGEIMG